MQKSSCCYLFILISDLLAIDEVQNYVTVIKL